MNKDNNNIWVSIGITKNIGNYESLRLDAGSKRVLEEGDDVSEIYKSLWKEVNDQIEGQLGEVAEYLG